MRQLQIAVLRPPPVFEKLNHTTLPKANALRCLFLINDGAQAPYGRSSVEGR